MEKDEIAEELKHHKAMLRELRRRLRERELQEVKHGLNVPGDITSDIHDLTERVQRHESEIARLQTLAVEDKEPLGEVEYRLMLAEAWDTPSGMPPGFTGTTRLELARLRLGISLERANTLEHFIRMALARERLSKLNEYEILWHFARTNVNTTDNAVDNLKFVFESLRDAIYLDPPIAMQWLIDASNRIGDAEASLNAVEWYIISDTWLELLFISNTSSEDTNLLFFFNDAFLKPLERRIKNPPSPIDTNIDTKNP